MTEEERQATQAMKQTVWDLWTEHVDREDAESTREYLVKVVSRVDPWALYVLCRKTKAVLFRRHGDIREMLDGVPEGTYTYHKEPLFVRIMTRIAWTPFRIKSKIGSMVFRLRDPVMWKEANEL